MYLARAASTEPAEVHPGVDTRTSTVAAMPAGDTIEQLETDEQFTEVAAFDPNTASVVVVPATKPVPLTVTVLAPVSEVHGVEALLPWQHPTRGLLYPDTLSSTDRLSCAVVAIPAPRQS